MLKRYTHQGHTNRVLAASKSRNGQRMVLLEMCRNAEFDRPEVTITKPQICNFTDLDRKTVQRAIRFLIEEGSIRAIRNPQGGRGVAVTYELVIVGGSQPDPQSESDRVRRRRDRISYLMKAEGVGYGQAADMVDAE